MIALVLAALAIIILIANRDKPDTFTFTCDKCGSHNVTYDGYGFKCHNCGAGYHN
jgi:hypothetical protein